MRLIRNVCKKCNNYNLLEREFNYEMGLCNKCLKKQIMPEIRYKGYFECGNFPVLPGRFIDVSNDNKYIVTSNGIYEKSSLDTLYSFKYEINTGVFSDNNDYFFGFVDYVGFVLKYNNHSWTNVKNINISRNIKSSIFSKREVFLIINEYEEKTKFAKFNIDDFKVKIISNLDNNLWKLYFKKPHYKEDLIKPDYEIPADLIDDEYYNDYNEIYPIDESHFVISDCGKFFVDLNNDKKVKIPFYAGVENNYVYSQKFDLLIYPEYIMDRSGFQKCLVVFSTKNNHIVTKLYFDYPITYLYISKDDNLLIVVTKNLSYVISTVNWCRLAVLGHSKEVAKCAILADKTIITETENGFTFIWNNIL